MKLRNFILELMDDLACLLFLRLGSLNEFPALVDFSSEHSDGVGVFLSELDGTLDSCGIRQDRVIKVLASKGVTSM